VGGSFGGGIGDVWWELLGSSSRRERALATRGKAGSSPSAKLRVGMTDRKARPGNLSGLVERVPGAKALG
jgi:hypothetical protein